MSLSLAEMYVAGKFREGTRSQESIRIVAKAVEDLPAEHSKLYRFFDEQLPWTALKSEADAVDIVDMCSELAAGLVKIDPADLSAKERQALLRTAAVLDQVLDRS